AIRPPRPGGASHHVPAPRRAPARQRWRATTCRAMRRVMSSAVLAEVCGVPERAVPAGVSGAARRIKGSGTDLARLVDGIELQPESRVAALVQQARGSGCDDAPQRLEAGIGRLHASAHVLHREEAAANHDVRLAPAGGAGGAYIIVGVLAGPDDGGIAGAAGDLPGESAGGGNRGALSL